MKKVYISIYEYACERRELDAQKIHNFLSASSYSIVSKPQLADIIIFITCGIIEKNTEACLHYIKKYQKYGAQLIVGGCGPGIDKERIQAIHKGAMFTTSDMSALDSLFPDQAVPFSSIDDAPFKFSMLDKGIFGSIATKWFFAIPRVKPLFKTIVRLVLNTRFGPYSFVSLKAVGLDNEYYIKIADGCVSHCSYCALSNAIGPLKSKPIASCLAEFKRGLEQGYTNFYLTGDDTGAYGIDCGHTLPDVLEEITSVQGTYNLLISSFNSAWLCTYIDRIESLVTNGRIKSMVIPVQSGNSEVLTAMNRFSDVATIKDAVTRIKKACPDIWLSTHIIVGFPTESDSAFYDTLTFATTTPFDEVQLFAFSLKPGTKAQDLTPRISEASIAARMNKARDFFKKNKYTCYMHKTDFLYASQYRAPRL